MELGNRPWWGLPEAAMETPKCKGTVGHPVVLGLLVQTTWEQSVLFSWLQDSKTADRNVQSRAWPEHMV